MGGIIPPFGAKKLLALRLFDKLAQLHAFLRGKRVSSWPVLAASDFVYEPLRLLESAPDPLSLPRGLGRRRLRFDRGSRRMLPTVEELGQAEPEVVADRYRIETR